MPKITGTRARATTQASAPKSKAKTAKPEPKKAEVKTGGWKPSGRAAASTEAGGRASSLGGAESGGRSSTRPATSSVSGSETGGRRPAVEAPAYSSVSGGE